jgi:hypothetical protein
MVIYLTIYSDNMTYIINRQLHKVNLDVLKMSLLYIYNIIIYVQVLNSNEKYFLITTNNITIL